jgi:hypothetical protein
MEVVTHARGVCSVVERNIEMAVSDITWRKAARVEAWTAQEGRCAYCRRYIAKAEVTADHVVPRSGGGTDTRNIAASCRPCNQLKGGMNASKFRRLLRSTAPVQGKSATWQHCLELQRLSFRMNRLADTACRRVARYSVQMANLSGSSPT